MLVALMLPALLILLALVVDLFIMFAAKWEQDNSAEFAALSAVEAMYRARSMGSASFAEQRAIERAETVAGQNYSLVSRRDKAVEAGEFQSGEAGRVEFGVWNEASGFSASGDPMTANSVRVVVRSKPDRVLGSYFSRFMGYDSYFISSEATAYLDQDVIVNLIDDNPFRLVR